MPAYSFHKFKSSTPSRAMKPSKYFVRICPFVSYNMFWDKLFNLVTTPLFSINNIFSFPLTFQNNISTPHIIYSAIKNHTKLSEKGRHLLSLSDVETRDKGDADQVEAIFVWWCSRSTSSLNYTSFPKQAHLRQGKRMSGLEKILIVNLSM